MGERLRHTSIRPLQFVLGMGDCHSAVAGMLVIAGIVGEVVARPCVQSPRRFPGLTVNVELRHEFASPLTKTVKPGYRLFAAHPIKDIIGEHFRNRAWITISENADTDAAIGQYRHPRTPADPAASVEHNALAPIAVQAEAEPAMHITVLGECGRRFMHARCLK